MALRKGKPLTFRPKGCSDTVDATNSFAGAMASLTNLIPNPSTDMTWVPRPASVQMTAFAGFNTPGFISGTLVVGDLMYGMIATGRNPGNDEPFVYNLKLNTFLTVTGITAANTPTSPATTGDWTPPILAVVGSKIIVTHPGFAGGAPGFFFGWFDISGFTSTTITGTTHNGTKVIDNLSTNVLQAGWTVGMTIADTTNPGDITAGTVITSIASNGLSITVSNNSNAGHVGDTLSVAGGTAASPLWAAGNTNGIPLASVPVSVAQMAGRAYYAVGNGVVFSDAGNALQVTNATQVLLFNNGVPVTALGPLPLASPVTGGIVQSLIAFQGVTAMQVIAGDASISAGSTGSLTVNILKSGTGTLSPLSIVPFTDGLAFMSPEGLRAINFAAQVSNPIGDHGTGIAVPFIYAIAPSRICAASNADTLRISVQNGLAPSQPQQEWWIDLTRKAWHGPHSFPASQIQPWSNTFVLVANGINAKLWRSDPTPSNTSTYTENGTPLSWEWQTSLLPDTGDMKMHALIELAVATDYPPQTQVVVTIDDESMSVLDTIFMAGSGVSSTIWGSFTWGGAVWFGGTGVMKQRRISPHFPIVFKQATVQLSGNSLGGLVIGNLYMRYQELGYLLENPL